MTVLDVVALTGRAGRPMPRYRLGGPALSARRARSVRQFAIANAILVLLAGWLASHGTYDELYGWLAVGLYLGTALVVQLLSVLPTVRRVPLGS